MKQRRVDLWSAGSYAVAPPALLDEHLPRGADRHLQPRLVAEFRPGANGARPDGDERAIAAALASVEGRLACQDQDGLSGEVLLPDPALMDSLLRADDDGRQRAGVHAYNSWAASLQDGANDRLIPVGQIPTTGLSDALAALEKAQAAGLRAVSLSYLPAGADTTPADGDDFWRLAGDRTVVCLGPTFGGTSFAERVAPAVTAGRGAPHVSALTRLALTGIWDEIPELRLVIAGVDAGWIPYVLEAADTNYLRTRASRPADLRRDDALPSEYVRQHSFATFGDDRFAALSARYFGPHHLMWSASLPTPRSEWPNDEQQAARVCEGLATDDRRRLLGENCHRLFGVTGSEPFTQTELADFDRPVLV